MRLSCGNALDRGNEQSTFFLMKNTAEREILLV